MNARLFAALGLASLCVTSKARADWSRPLKPAPLVCVGMQEVNPDLRISLKVQYAEKDGKPGAVVDYTVDGTAPVRLENVPLPTLDSEGTLNIFQRHPGYVLGLGAYDGLDELAKGDYSKRYELVGDVTIAAGEFRVLCKGRFAP